MTREFLGRVELYFQKKSRRPYFLIGNMDDEVAKRILERDRFAIGMGIPDWLAYHDSFKGIAKPTELTGRWFLDVSSYLRYFYPYLLPLLSDKLKGEPEAASRVIIDTAVLEVCHAMGYEHDKIDSTYVKDFLYELAIESHSF